LFNLILYIALYWATVSAGFALLVLRSRAGSCVFISFRLANYIGNDDNTFTINLDTDSAECGYVQFRKIR